MRNRTSAEKQHFVPKFLLRGFADRKTRQLCVFDKSNGNVFALSPEKAAKQGGYYDIETPEGALTLEKPLADLESRVAVTIAEVIRSRSLASLTKRTAEDLALFAAAQMVRTENTRQQLLHMSAELADWTQRLAKQMSATSDLKPLTAAGAKAVSMSYLASAHDMAPHFLAKAWILLEPAAGLHFITSDNPVALHNSVDHGWRGSLGLAVRGIEVYLPLSRDLTLSFMCPSHIDLAHDSLQEAKAIAKVAPKMAGVAAQLSSASEEMLKAYESGTPWAGNARNVTFVNHLQIKNSERFLYGPSRDYSLAQEMIAKHPRLRAGPRVLVQGVGSKRSEA